jgi:hypothetical protein
MLPPPPPDKPTTGPLAKAPERLLLDERKSNAALPKRKSFFYKLRVSERCAGLKKADRFTAVSPLYQP